MMLSVYTSKKFENTVTAINVFLNQVEIQYPSNVCKYHFFARGESPFSRETKREWLSALSCIVPTSFSPGALDAFHSSEFNYGAVMCACTVVVPAAFILWPRVVSIRETLFREGST